MSTTDRVASFAGMTLGLLLVWLTLSAALQLHGWCGEIVCRRGWTWDAGAPVTVQRQGHWQPYIDNPGGLSLVPSTAPVCPKSDPLGPDRRIESAPLPNGYDPARSPKNPVSICVRASATGKVVDAKLLRTTGSQGLDRSIVRLVVSSWRLNADADAPSRSGWHRIRIDPGPSEHGIAPLFYVE